MMTSAGSSDVWTIFFFAFCLFYEDLQQDTCRQHPWQLRIHLHPPLHIHVHMRVHIHLHLHAHAHVHLSTHTHTHTHTHARTHARAGRRMHVWCACKRIDPRLCLCWCLRFTTHIDIGERQVYEISNWKTGQALRHSILRQRFEFATSRGFGIPRPSPWRCPSFTPNLHSKIQVFSDPTLGKSYAITYKTKVSGQPNPWNKSW